LQREAVSRLDLDRGHALGEQRFESRQTLIEELLLRGGPHRAHAREDAAPGPGDFRVRAAPQALGVLRRAAAGKHEVGMAVDEPRGHPVTAQVVRLVRPAGLGQIALRAQPLDARAPGEQRPGRETSHRGVAGGDADVAPQVQILDHERIVSPPVSLPTPFGYNARPHGPRPRGLTGSGVSSSSERAKKPPEGLFVFGGTKWASRPFLFYDDHVSYLARAAHRPHRAPRRAAGLRARGPRALVRPR